MKNAVWKALLLVVLVAVLVGVGSAREVVAEVNGEKVTREELNLRFGFWRAFFEKQKVDFSGPGGKEMLAKIEKEVLQALIEEKLIAQAATQQGIGVSEAEVNAQLEALGLQKGVGLDRELRRQGMNREKLAELLQGQLLADKLYQRVTAKVGVTSEEVKKYYLENKENLPPESLESLAGRIEAFLLNQKKNECFTQYVQTLRKQAQVVNRLEKS